MLSAVPLGCESNPDKGSGMIVIGADEVGSGDTFCGLVVSAACVDEEQGEILKAFRVRDCKKISDSRIGQYVGLIRKAGVRHSTIAITPDAFNELSSQMSHVQIQNMLYQKAISNLLGKVGRPDKIIVDRYPGAKIAVDHIDLVMVPKAEERYVAVAAASILARSAYLGMKRSLERELGMRIPLGSRNVREALRDLLKKEVDVSRYAKLYPNNVREVLRETR